MKITFLYPKIMSGTSRDATQPMVFAILAGLTPPDVERVLYDQRIETIPFGEPTDLAVLTVGTFAAKSAYTIAAHYRRRGIPVVMGGHHPTLVPEEALKWADTIVLGDAESVWSELVRDARKGTLKRIYDDRFPDLGGLKPDRSIFKGKRYLPLSLVQYGRGCRFSCDFCSVHAFYGSNIRHRPVLEVIEEIRECGQGLVFITDDNLFANRAKAEELLRMLKPLRTRWVCQISLDIATNSELVSLMADAGCIAVIVGFESLIDENLKQMNKTWNRASGDYEKLVKNFYDHGIMIYGTFVFGYDHDTIDSFPKSLNFAVRSKFLSANFNPLAPLPGTPLYNRLYREGRLIHNPWWIHPDFRYGESWFKPEGMTAEQLSEGCYRARTDFNKPSSILRRALNWRANFRNLTNAYIYLVLNRITRQEIRRKQWQSMGYGGKTEPSLMEGLP
jgi:radical SAM superfamily enzyme YgiQ (UPF0313 family)